MKIENLLINLKSQNYCRIATLTNMEIIKALLVVYEGIKVCATDRGLHFLRIWFKNKVPHHPATLM